MAKQQKFKVDIERYDLDDAERAQLESEILQYVKERTKQGTGAKRRGRGYSVYAFPAYSEEYVKSKKFKRAGKRRNPVNLVLDNRMLESMDVLRSNDRAIEYGFQSGTEENAKAEGNQLGSYGRGPNPAKARSFLPLSRSEVDVLVEKVKGDQDAS